MTARTPIRETSVFEAALGIVEKSYNVMNSSSTDSMRFHEIRQKNDSRCKKVPGMVSCFANHTP